MFPSLLSYDVVSNIYKQVSLKKILSKDGTTAFNFFSQLDIHYINNNELIGEIWKVATDKKYAQNKAYDAAYIAVANYKRLNLWTFEKRLLSYGFKNVKLIGTDKL